MIKLNSFELRAKAGFTHRSPRWAVAYKFAAQQTETEVLNIIASVGRLGTITPVAKLRPVSVGGVTVPTRRCITLTRSSGWTSKSATR